MTENSKLIAKTARELGILDGDTVLVHSSLKSLGIEKLTPREVIEGLVEAVGTGTIVFPTLSYMYCNKDNPVFDYYATPSNVGAIPEYFRTEWKGAVRSLSPTHSCAAYGKNAEYIVSNQERDTTPCGENSPFRKVMQLDGKILFLGCGINCNTSMHAVEELVAPDYLFGKSYDYSLLDRNGKEHKMSCASHGFDGVSQCYYRVVELMNKNDYTHGYIAAAECWLLKAKPMWKAAEEKMKQDNHYFIDTA